MARSTSHSQLPTHLGCFKDEDDVVRFVFRNLMFNHGITCEACSGMKSVSKNKALKTVNASLFSMSKDSR